MCEEWHEQSRVETALTEYRVGITICHAVRRDIYRVRESDRDRERKSDRERERKREKERERENNGIEIR